MAITSNREYLEASLNKFGLNSNDIDLIVVENKVYEGTIDINMCKLAMYNSLSSILPVSNIQEGGYSVTWNLEAIKLWYDSLCKELGKPNAMKPKIRNASNYW